MKKKIVSVKIFTFLFSVLALSSCELFELDNYDEPQETIQGAILDAVTGDSILTDQGSEGIRIRMTQLDYSDNAEHNPDFYAMPNGFYRNTKVFKGLYNVRVDGPFVPIIRENADGVPVADESEKVYVEGTVNLDFHVRPFLKVEFVGYPTVSNGEITAKVKVTRGVERDELKTLIEPTGDWSDDYANITDIQLFVSYSSTVGYRARDERWSNKIEYSGNAFDSLIGEPVTITSVKGQAIPSGRHVWVRAAARINYDTPVGSGTRRWNYSPSMEVIIP